MSIIYGPPVPGSAEPPPPPPPMPWQPTGGPVRRPHRRRRGIALTAACVVVALAAALALLTTQTAPHKPVSRTSAIAAAVDPGVVDVVATLGYQNAMSEGTGLVLTSSGEVLTNNHVIEGATSVKVTDVGDDRTYSATIVGYDQSGDVAVLQAQGASDLKTITPGSSAKVRIGEAVIALGNAGGKGGTPAAATGKVTGLNESIIATDQAEHSSEHLTGLIRTSLPLRPGDSGGALVATSGTVIGMNTAASSAYQFQSGAEQAFAIPIDQAVAVASQIEVGRASATVHIGATGFLGVQLAQYPVPFTSQTEMVVVGVMAGLPAAKAGIAPGDVIVSVNGHAVASPSDIQALLEPYHPGGQVRIAWQNPSGLTYTATVVLAIGPAD